MPPIYWFSTDTLSCAQVATFPGLPIVDEVKIKRCWRCTEADVPTDEDHIGLCPRCRTWLRHDKYKRKFSARNREETIRQSAMWHSLEESGTPVLHRD